MPEYSNYLESRNPLTDEEVEGDEILGCSKDGNARSLTSQQIANLGTPGSGITREFNRTFSETILFDKNEMTYAIHTMSGDLSFSIATSGNIVDQFSGMRSRIIADGEHSVSFGDGFDFLYGITNGEILDAGTYEIYFLYLNGSVSVIAPGVSSETAALIQLAQPGNFLAEANGENTIDLSWDAVSNASGYQIDVSLNGSSGWTLLENLTGTSTSHTGLLASDTRFYRIKATGDGVVYSDSTYAEDSATTQDAGDVTAPTFTFSPVNGNSTHAINEQIVITASEALHNDADNTMITNANIASKITLKETNSGGANIPFTATIDVSGTIVTIRPTTIYGANQLVYVAIDNVEDSQGNEVSGPTSITFTTTEYTLFDGATNFLRFGDILENIFTVADTKFKLRITLDEAISSGSRFLIGKYSAIDNQRAFYWYINGSDVYFSWAKVHTGANRSIKWTGVYTSGEHALELIYDGSIDSNNGLDRVTLNIDGVTQGSKTLLFTDGTLGDINNNGSQLSFGAGVNDLGVPTVSFFYGYQAKDMQILSGVSDVVELDVPLLRTGEDISGNNRNGTWG